MTVVPSPQRPAADPAADPAAVRSENLRPESGTPAAARGMLGGLLILLGCAAACSLPLLLGSGAAVAAAGVLSGRGSVVIVVLVAASVTAGVTVGVVLRRRRPGSTACAGDCTC